MRSRGTWLASSLAPLATLVVVYCVFMLGSALQFRTWAGLAAASEVAVVATIISYLLTLVVGIPTHAFLQGRHWHRLGHYGWAGFVPGALPFVALSAYMADRIVVQRRLTPDDVHVAVFLDFSWSRLWKCDRYRVLVSRSRVLPWPRLSDQ
jgi:hypothetical protein